LIELELWLQDSFTRALAEVQQTLATLGPIALREARQFVAQYHRHNEPPRGWLFGVAL
jgi:hypothetical protein